MLWRKKRAPEVPVEVLGNLSDMSLDEQMLATENVMTCREFLNLFMHNIAEHRSDGHDCLPYCMPIDLHENLEGLDTEEVKMILTVALKDMYNVYVHYQEHHEQ